VAILGLSYKPHTHIVEESQSVILAQRLADSGYEVSVHDPKAMEAARAILGGRADYEYRRLDWHRMETSMRDDGVLIDGWRIARDVCFEKIRYVGIGLGSRHQTRTPVGEYGIHARV